MNSGMVVGKIANFVACDGSSLPVAYAGTVCFGGMIATDVESSVSCFLSLKFEWESDTFKCQRPFTRIRNEQKKIQSELLMQFLYPLHFIIEATENKRKIRNRLVSRPVQILKAIVNRKTSSSSLFCQTTACIEESDPTLGGDRLSAI